MAVIGLIRHGITDWNIAGKAQGLADIPLGEEGRQQAVKLAAKMRGEHWEVIFHSPLSRAAETAQIIADTLGISERVTDDRIREMDCGLIEGMTERERTEKWGEHWRKLELGLETVEAVGRRGTLFLEDICTLYHNRKVLVVSHGALIGVTLQRLMPQRFTTTYIDNTSLTVLIKENNSWECQLYNCMDHLLNGCNID